MYMFSLHSFLIRRASDLKDLFIQTIAPLSRILIYVAIFLSDFYNMLKKVV